MARAIAVEIVGDASSVNRAFRSAGTSAKTFNNELGRTTRGAIAGSGIFAGLGRSLAFASGGFLALEGITSTIRASIEGAESLEKAQRGLTAAIQHTGGSLKVLKPQYEDTARAAAQFGVNQADATTALERATVLTGDAGKAQRAYKEALVISKATGKDFNAVLTATAKGQEGVTTSLQRYGILIQKGTPGQEQFNTVMARFGGQAKANTSTIDKFNATWQNTEEILGTALLPTLNHLLSRFTEWLTKMQRSGQLQRDVNRVVHDASGVFHALESVVHGVDKVTGSFVHTLELLAAFKFASMVAGWSGSLTGLIAKWRGVTAAATIAEGAEARAAGGAGGVAARVGQYTGAGAAGAAASRGAGLGSLGTLGSIAAATFGGIPDQLTGQQRLLPQFRPGKAVGNGPLSSIFGSLANAINGLTGALKSTAPASGAPKTFRFQFGLTYAEQLAEAQAAVTQGTGDDVAAAKQEVARIKGLIAQGRIKGKALLTALGLEANALSTIWSAENAAAQKRAAAAAKAKARIAAQIQDSIDPQKLELQLAKDQALGRSTVKDLKALKKAAQKALASGKLSIQQQIQAYNQITSINQQLQQSANASTNYYKQLNTKKIADSIKGLTKAQRKALRAALSQVGPHGTVPGSGVGAEGYVIGPNGRPIHVHNHVSVDIDGKRADKQLARHAQRRRRRNSSQRRGPNAGG